MRPGSFAWFAAHDIRLAGRRVRAFFGKSSGLTIAAILGVALLIFHVLAWAAAHEALSEGRTTTTDLYPLAATLTLFVLPWIVSQALTNATRALYSRGDLDIIMASPMSARSVLTARSLAIALESIGAIAIFLLPLANMMALVVDVRWLAIYPTLVATALFGTGLGLALTMGLFWLCGPRRTRTVAQIIATLIGAGFALALQGANIAPAEYRQLLKARLAGAHAGDLYDVNGWLWTPVRASAGDWQALALWFGVAILVFFAAALTLSNIFARGVISTGAAASADRAQRPQKIRFRGGVGFALRQKEWRLLSRDPWLASQILLQIIYTMPISVVLWNAMGPGGSIVLATAPALVAIASHVSASLAWLTVSSEDAPEFLATAPVTRQQIERRKLQAIALPLFALFAAPVFFIWVSARYAGIMTLAYVLAATISAALLNLWRPMPGRRSDLLRRHSQSKLVGMIEHTLALFWAVALALTAYWSMLAIIPVACAVLLLWVNRPKAAVA